MSTQETERLAKEWLENNIMKRMQSLQDDVQALQHLYVRNGIAPITSVLNDVQTGDGSGNWVTTPIATFEALVKIYMDTQYAAEVNAEAIFQCNSPGGQSLWTGTYVAAGSSGVTIKATTVTGLAAVMVAASTGQLAKMRLYNTTRGNNVLISQCVAGAPNTITSVSAPVGWVNGDALTIASQTLTGGGFSWVDLEVNSGPTGRLALFIKMQLTNATVSQSMRLHPLEATFSASKNDVVFSLSTTTTTTCLALVKMTSNVFCLAWEGTPTAVTLRESGFLG